MCMRMCKPMSLICMHCMYKASNAHALVWNHICACVPTCMFSLTNQRNVNSIQFILENFRLPE